MDIKEAVNNITNGEQVFDVINILLDSNKKAMAALVGGVAIGAVGEKILRRRKLKKRMKEIAHKRWAGRIKPVHPEKKTNAPTKPNK
jgi:hypothetical protein